MATERPPRLLVAAPMHQDHYELVVPWLANLVRQETGLLWDVLLVDGTPHPDALYLSGMRALARDIPLYGHRVRLKRFGVQADGRYFPTPEDERRYAHSVIFESFANSLSYDHLLCLDVTTIMQTEHCIEALGYVPAPWASLDNAERALAGSLLDGAMVRAVPFVMSTLDSDAGYEAACRESGYPPRVRVGSLVGLTG